MRLGVMIFTRAVAGLGDTLYATHQICMNVQGLTFMTGWQGRGGVRISDINISNKTVSINKTVEWIGSRPQIKNSPKTDAGNREIPLTDKLIELIKPLMKQNYIFQNEA